MHVLCYYNNDKRVPTYEIVEGGIDDVELRLDELMERGIADEEDAMAFCLDDRIF